MTPFRDVRLELVFKRGAVMLRCPRCTARKSLRYMPKSLNAWIEKHTTLNHYAYHLPMSEIRKAWTSPHPSPKEVFARERIHVSQR